MSKTQEVFRLTKAIIQAEDLIVESMKKLGELIGDEEAGESLTKLQVVAPIDPSLPVKTIFGEGGAVVDGASGPQIELKVSRKISSTTRTAAMPFEERTARFMSCLSSEYGTTATEIAELTGLTVGACNARLAAMCREGKLLRLKRGKYRLPKPNALR